MAQHRDWLTGFHLGNYVQRLILSIDQEDGEKTQTLHVQ